MGKYYGGEKAVFSVFNSSAWKGEKITTIPSNFVLDKPLSEFIRVNIISDGTGVNLKSGAGIIIADIFSPAGIGPSRASFIADKLDAYLQGKSFSVLLIGTLQMGQSSMSPKGIDTANSALYRAQYTIPFNFYGV